MQVSETGDSCRLVQTLRRASQESSQLRSRVEPEHDRDYDIPIHQHVLRQLRKRSNKKDSDAQTDQDHPFQPI